MCVKNGKGKNKLENLQGEMGVEFGICTIQREGGVHWAIKINDEGKGGGGE